MYSKTEITVRYAETDRMGIAHHSVYPIWFEVGRTEFIKDYGITYSEIEEKGIMMPLCGLSCYYKLPAQYEDKLEIQTAVTAISGCKITFTYRAVRKSDGALLGGGQTQHGFVDAVSFRPVSIKRKMPKLYEMLFESIRENPFD